MTGAGLGPVLLATGLVCLLVAVLWAVAYLVKLLVDDRDYPMALLLLLLTLGSMAAIVGLLIQG